MDDRLNTHQSKPPVSIDICPFQNLPSQVTSPIGSTLLIGFPPHICISIETTSQAYRVTLDVTTGLSVVVSEIVVVEISFLVVVLTRKSNGHL